MKLYIISFSKLNKNKNNQKIVPTPAYQYWEQMPQFEFSDEIFAIVFHPITKQMFVGKKNIETKKKNVKTKFPLIFFFVNFEKHRW